LGGDCHAEGKVLSLFEAHTEVIRKGKAHKPNEFARLEGIDEVENGIVSGYQVLVGNPADTTVWMPAPATISSLLPASAGDGHRRPRIFFCPERVGGRSPWGKEGGAAGAGTALGPAAQQQKQRWFRRSLRWRAGCEATISTLEHPFSMERATYQGEHGFQRYVGWCV
jgi:IS5 family transposase